MITFNSDLLLICNALAYPGAKVPKLRFTGPTDVIFEKIAEVLTLFGAPIGSIPPALLSDSNPSEVEIAGMSAS